MNRMPSQKLAADEDIYTRPTAPRARLTGMVDGLPCAQPARAAHELTCESHPQVLVCSI